MTTRDAFPVRVLIVDDEPALRDLLSMVCAYEGWTPVAVEAGKPALEAAAARRPDVVLLDRMLPDVDGLELLRWLQAEVPGLPVVIVSARDSTADRAAALAGGAAACVLKPFGIGELTATIRRVLAARPATSA